jgi:succinate dehydrogenase / fumarate reductase membrane anchor subunit
LYEKAILEYQSPLFTIGEFGLVACVAFHAMNGLRIIFFDYRPSLWHLQQRAASIVFIASVVVSLIFFVPMLNHVLHFYDSGRQNDLPTVFEIMGSMAQFLLGFIVIIVVALGLSFAYALITNEDPKAKPLHRPSQIDAWMWSFMRVSGLLIVPLVFGHLAMLHIIQGVFEINVADANIVGTTAVNESGTAVEFVGQRWNYLVAGVAVWRIYDGALLALVVIHGFNGLRYVVNDYAHHKVVNRALNWVIVFGGAALIILGMAALLAGVDETAYRIASEASNGVFETTSQPTDNLQVFGG